MGDPQLKLRRLAPPRNRKAAWLGCAAGLLSWLRFRRVHRVTSGDLQQHDFPTSAQRMGIRFTDRIRDTFRFRWLRRTR